jgi:hypothetical protein
MELYLQIITLNYNLANKEKMRTLKVYIIGFILLTNGKGIFFSTK